jgi:predicted nucleic acid-binding protein
VIRRPQIRARFRTLTDDVVAEFIARIERIAVRVDEVATDITLARDPKDEPYINLAIQSQADYLVSRDRDLLEGADAIAKNTPSLRILDPVAFLIAVRKQIGNNP